MSHVDEGTLHEYLDGQLSSDEESRVESHVAECPVCSAALDDARALTERAAAILGHAAPAVGKPPSVRPPLAATPRWPATRLAWAATVAIAVTGGWLAHSIATSQGWLEPPMPTAAPVQERVASSATEAESSAPREAAPSASRGRAEADEQLPALQSPEAPSLREDVAAERVAENVPDPEGDEARRQTRDADRAAEPGVVPLGAAARVAPTRSLADSPSPRDALAGYQIVDAEPEGTLPRSVTYVSPAGDTVVVSYRETRGAEAGRGVPAVDTTAAVGGSGSVIVVVTGNLPRDSLRALLRELESRLP